MSRDLLRRLPVLAQRWRAGVIDAATFAGLYFLHWQIAMHAQTFASRKNKSDTRPNATQCLALMETVEGEDLRQHLLDWLGRYQFHGVIGNVPMALAQWLRGAWPLVLREDVPEPVEVLRMQARGQRAVTVISEYPRLHQPVLGKPDAFAFFLHDLEHAWKFFHSPSLHAGQREFFGVLENAVDLAVFEPYLDDAEFVTRLHYLMSDMNTHPEHGRQYLRAILVEHHLRRERKTPSDTLSVAAEQDIRKTMRAIETVVPAPAACATAA